MIFSITSNPSLVHRRYHKHRSSRRPSKVGALSHGKLLEIMDTKKPSVPPRDPMLTISVSKIARYFPTGYTQEQMVGIIMQLLERNSRHLMPEKQTSLER